MIDAIHISETGLKATQSWLDQLSNNVANMHTPGYKKMSAHFQDIVSSPLQSVNVNIASAQSLEFSGMGSRMSKPSVDMAAGSYSGTSRPLDVAIKGNGLFEVILENGEFAYTRLGSLQINKDGFLAVQGGHMLSDRIQVPADLKSIDIASNGTVTGVYSDSGIHSDIQLGRIQLADVTDSSSLKPMGNAMFQVENDSDIVLRQAGESGNGELMQGFLEMSNVDLVKEMTNLVLAQRAYQLNARMIQAADQVLETVNNLRR